MTYNDIFMKQMMMRKAVIALVPVYLWAIWMYGVQVLMFSLVVFPCAVLIEYCFEKRAKRKTSEAIFMTCGLYVLALPPGIALWQVALGIILAVIFAKEVYGGFGRNPFNVAIAGRMFLYLLFPSDMTTFGWLGYGNFGVGADAVSQATPLYLLRFGEGDAVAQLDWTQLFLGLHAGSIGETSILAILIGAIYLLVTKTASWRIMLSTVGSGLLLTALLQFLQVPQAIPTLPAMLSGSFLFVAVYMATDPVTAPKTFPGMWVYGTIVGVTAIVVRTFSLFPEGTSFGILFANIFTSWIDDTVMDYEDAKQAKLAARKGGGA